MRMAVACSADRHHPEEGLRQETGAEAHSGQLDNGRQCCATAPPAFVCLQCPYLGVMLGQKIIGSHARILHAERQELLHAQHSGFLTVYICDAETMSLPGAQTAEQIDSRAAAALRPYISTWIVQPSCLMTCCRRRCSKPPSQPRLPSCTDSHALAQVDDVYAWSTSEQWRTGLCVSRV